MRPSSLLIARRSKVDLLGPGGAHREIHKTPLELRPLVAHGAREMVRVFLERLMENPDDNQSTPAPRSEFGEFLKQVNVGSVARRGFEELAHLVDEDNEPAASPGIACRNRRDRIENPLLGPRWRRFPRRQPARCLDCLANDLRGPVAAPRHRQDAPTPASRRQGLAQQRCGPLTEELLPRPLGASRDSPSRLPSATARLDFPPAVRPGPRKCALVRFKHVTRHALENLGRRTRTDEAFQRRGIAEIRFKADGAPVPACDVDPIRE